MVQIIDAYTEILLTHIRTNHDDRRMFKCRAGRIGLRSHLGGYDDQYEPQRAQHLNLGTVPRLAETCRCQGATWASTAY